MDITSFLEKNFGKGKELDHESAENVLRDALLCFELSELEPVWRELIKQNSGNRHVKLQALLVVCPASAISFQENGVIQPFVYGCCCACYARRIVSFVS